MDPLEHIIAFLKQTDELATAVQLLKSFKKYAVSLEQYDQLGRLFNDVKDYHEAIDCASRTLVMSANPQQMYAARANLAKMYNQINRPDKALQYVETNLSINEADYEAKMEKMFSFYLQGNLTESEAINVELVADPNCPQHIKERCQYNLGSYQMDKGNFKEGIRNFIDVGHKIGIWSKAPLPGAAWDGKYHEGATIAIQAEGGIGDEIINVRFMKRITEMGMNAVWVTNHDGVTELFNRNNITTVRKVTDVEEENVLWARSFYLPILLDLDVTDLWESPYLTADPAYVEKWKGILPATNKKRVALRWSGNPMYEQDLHRSLSLAAYMDAYGHNDVQFVSVQRDFGLEELPQFPNVFDASPYLETLEDLLACLSLMDVVLSSCTSVAHVAAASGVTTHVYPPIACYYVWQNTGNDWYGNHVHVHRQRQWKDWSFIKDVSIL